MAPLLRRPEVHLVLVGGGSPTLENLRAHVAERNLQHKVHFTGHRADIPNVLAGFDIFALATEQEASGTVFVEAAAAGLPVIGTDVGGVSEMMQDGVTGLLVPLHDPEALASALRELVDNPEKRREMGRAGFHLQRETGRFSVEALVADTEACYARWLDRS
jgi:glycosyltransferase involved in cell wall biosynthesis